MLVRVAIPLELYILLGSRTSSLIKYNSHYAIINKTLPSITTGKSWLIKTKNEHLFIKSHNDYIKITKTLDFYPLFRYYKIKKIYEIYR